MKLDGVARRSGLLAGVLLAAGVAYMLIGPVGVDHGWSEHDYAAWGLLVGGLAILALVTVPSLVGQYIRRKRRRGR